MAPKQQLTLYNPADKEWFLSERYSNENTRMLYRKRLMKFGQSEQLKGKDLYEFSYDEIIDTLRAVKASTGASITVLKSIIVQYINWAITKGKTSSNINLLVTLRRTDLSKFVSRVKVKLQYLKNQDELYNLCNFCVNATDACIFIFAYFGIDGVEHYEMTNLKKDDIEENGLSVPQKDGTKRFVCLPDRFMEFVREAAEEKIYFKSNDMKEMNNRSYKLEESPYILRPAHRVGHNPEGKVSAQIINQRCKKIAELYDAAPGSGRTIDRLNPKNVLISGLFDKLSEIEKDKDLSKSDYENVLSYYGIRNTLWTEYKYRYESFKQALS